MPFEDIPSTPAADALVDRAFSRAARAGGAKTGIDAQQSMLNTATNILADNLEHVSRSWPDLDAIHPFHRHLAEAVVDVGTLRKDLSSVNWAASQVRSIGREHRQRIRGDAELAKRQRKQAFARMADVLDEVADSLTRIETARRSLGRLPGIDPEQPTIVIAGFPNVGKSTFLNAVTRASVKTASYPFTTTQIDIGHVTERHITYQLIDTPGLLDRPLDERNDIERQAIAALEHLADVVLVFIDASETCGYPIEDQLALRDGLQDTFSRRGIPVISVCSKSDISTDIDADFYLSVTEDDGIEAVLSSAIDAIGVETTLPFERD